LPGKMRYLALCQEYSLDPRRPPRDRANRRKCPEPGQA